MHGERWRKAIQDTDDTGSSVLPFDSGLKRYAGSEMGTNSIKPYLWHEL